MKETPGRKCSVCSHEAFPSIVRAISDSVPLSELASRYGLQKSSLSRCSLNHQGRAPRGNGATKNANREPQAQKRVKGAKASRIASDGRCEACGQLVDAENLDPQSLIRRAERLLAQSERIALKAEQVEDSRLALMAIDRAQKSLDSLAKIHGLIGPDSVTLVDQRQVNVYADWPTASLEALSRFHEALSQGASVPQAIAIIEATKSNELRLIE